jgi:hypothetical protein
MPSMVVRYIGLAVLTVIMAQILVVSELQLRFAAEPEDPAAAGRVPRRELQSRQSAQPLACFKSSTCDAMNYDDATAYCARNDGHLCTPDELQRYAFEGNPNEGIDGACASTWTFESNSFWADDSDGTICAAGEQAFRLAGDEPPCNEGCTSEEDDCCAPWDEAATCRDPSEQPVPYLQGHECHDDPEGNYRCCERASSTSFGCIAAAAAATDLKSVMCCKTFPFLEVRKTPFFLEPTLPGVDRFTKTGSEQTQEKLR